MLKSKYIKVEVLKRNHSSLIKKYNLDPTIKVGDIVDIPINLIPKGSNYNVEVQCDYCNKLLLIPYKRYNKYTEVVNKYSCSAKDCSNQKIKDVCQLKYGVDNPFQDKKTKEKIKKIIIEKYGVEHQMYSSEVKSKIKQTNLEKYGVDNYTKTDEYKIKATKTNLEKYGVEWSLQSKDVREKGKTTNLKKYGVEYSSQSKLIREKVEKSCYDKYGHKTNLLNQLNIEMVKNTLIKKYNTDNPMKSDIIRRNNFINCRDNKYITYLDNKVSLYNCNKGHEFKISSDNYISRSKSNLPLCTICNPIGDSSSIKENELYGFIKYFYDGEVIKSYRDGMEIDIYLPELNIGFEFNGLYWHSEVNKEKNYHLYKTNYFKEKGINIIHIWEDDWDLKSDIIKSQIKNWIGLSENKIYARKCYIKEVTDIKVIKDFLNSNHIQGYTSSMIKLGLYHNDELVSIMIFDQYEGRKKMEESGWNLSRFCNKLNHNVVGGASKLLNYFIKNYNPTRIVSYADRTWTSGNMYHKLGFDMVEHTRPDYKYIVENKRVHKSRFRKSNLNTDLTERQYMLEQGIHRIYDCGKVKFQLKIK